MHDFQRLLNLAKRTNLTLIASDPLFANSEFKSVSELMKNNGLPERRMNNTLKTNLAFAELLGTNILFHDINERSNYFLLRQQDQKY
jgi:hypothetical protein